MLFRIMMVLFLLVIAAVPAWAGESSSIERKIRAVDEYQMQYNQKREKSPLSKLCIESKQWCEGNTYYVRYTLTNPTDELIQEDNAYMTIGYEVFSANMIPLLEEYSCVMPELAILPHESYSFTVAVPQQKSFAFINPFDTFFWLNEYEYINYQPMTPTEPSSVSLVPTVLRLPDGQIALSIENRVYPQTDTELRDVSVAVLLESEKYPDTTAIGIYTPREPIPFSAKSNETAVVPLEVKLFQEQEAIGKSRLIDAVELDASFAIKNYALTAKVNDILYRRDYNVLFNPSLYEFKSLPITNYHLEYWHDIPEIGFVGSYRIDDSRLTAYIRLKNKQNESLSLEQPSFKLHLAYISDDSHRKNTSYKLVLSEPLCLANNEEAFLSFSVLLPDDIAVVPLAPKMVVTAVCDGEEKFFGDYLVAEPPSEEQTIYRNMGEAGD